MPPALTALPDDTLLYPIVSDLAACLCAEFAGEALCFCGIEPATGVPIEIGGCDSSGTCGAVSVRLVRVFPSTAFPVPDRLALCTTALAMEIVVAAYRCVPVGGDDGSNPTAEQYAGWAQQQYADMAAMRRAIACCFGNSRPDVDYTLGDYTPLTPSGGVGGGQWTVYSSQEL
jgi:hypothetical protein